MIADGLRRITEEITQKQITLGFLVFLFLWIGYLLVVAREWRLTDRGLPMLVGIIALVLIAIHGYSLVRPAAFQWFLPEENGEEELEELVDLQSQFETGGGREIPGIVLITWMLAFAVLIYYLGFYLAMPVYLFVTVWYLRKSVRDALLATLVLSLFVFVGFGILLELRLWEGMVFR